MKRFSQDLLKVLKSQASKQVSLQEFPSAYHRTFGRTFDIVDYGVCDVQDLLMEVPEGMLTVSAVQFCFVLYMSEISHT